MSPEQAAERGKLAAGAEATALELPYKFGVELFEEFIALGSGFTEDELCELEAALERAYSLSPEEAEPLYLKITEVIDRYADYIG